MGGGREEFGSYIARNRFAEWMGSGSGQEEEIKRRVLALRDADWFIFLGSNGDEVNKYAKPDQYANGKAGEVQRTRYYEEEETDTWAFAWMPVIEDFVKMSKEIANEPSTGQQCRTITQHQGPSGSDSNYNIMLSSDKGFRNPSAVEAMGRFYHVSQSLSFLVDMSDDGHSEGDWFYLDLRNEQDKIWADNSVKKGIALARAGKHMAAVECYDAALKVCHRHLDALTARGAALANIGNLHSAVVAFEMALEVNPMDANATKYLEATRKKLALKAYSDQIVSPTEPIVHSCCSTGDHFGGGNAPASSSSSTIGTQNVLSKVVMPLNKERLVLTGAGGRVIAKEKKKYGFVGLDGEEVMEGDEDVDSVDDDDLSLKEVGESSSNGMRHKKKQRKRDKKAKKRAKKALKKSKKKKRRVEVSENDSSSSSD